jgi:hypothetical protein
MASAVEVTNLLDKSISSFLLTNHLPLSFLRLGLQWLRYTSNRSQGGLDWGWMISFCNISLSHSCPTFNFAQVGALFRLCILENSQFACGGHLDSKQSTLHQSLKVAEHPTDMTAYVRFIG